MSGFTGFKPKNLSKRGFTPIGPIKKIPKTMIESKYLRAGIAGQEVVITTYDPEYCFNPQWLSVSMDGFFNFIGTPAELRKFFPEDFQAILDIIKRDHGVEYTLEPIAEEEIVQMKSEQTAMTQYAAKFMTEIPSSIVDSPDGWLIQFSDVLFRFGKHTSYFGKKRCVNTDLKREYPIICANIENYLQQRGHNYRF